MGSQRRSREGKHSPEIPPASFNAGEKPEILKAYLDTFRREVQRYFPVPAGSPLEAVAKLT
jgi:hypothetical protein